MVANDKARAIGFPLRPTPPEEPLTRIRPHKSWAAVDAREVWAHRELFLLLMWRDLKVRYKQTLLGAAWRDLDWHNNIHSVMCVEGSPVKLYTAEALDAP